MTDRDVQPGIEPGIEPGIFSTPAREPDNQTRRTAYSVLAAVDRDRRALRMIAAHEADPGLVDCTPECIASAALSADQAWPWAAVAVLRWLCEPWPKDETRAEAREVE